MKRLRSLCLLLLLSCLCGESFAQKRRAPEGDRLQEMRERWGQKTESERALLRRRFEQLKGLTEEERSSLRDRARRFEQRRESLEKTTSEEDRLKIDALPRWERERHWRDRTCENWRDEGRRMLDKLPSELRRKLEHAAPHERRQILEEFKTSSREGRSGRVLRELGGRLGLTREEVRRLEALPLEQRLQKVVQLERQSMERRINANGLPRWLTEEQWNTIRSLPDEDFLHTIRRMQGRSGGGADGQRDRGSRSRSDHPDRDGRGGSSDGPRRQNKGDRPGDRPQRGRDARGENDAF